MERKFTGFLIPILIATLVYLLFFTNGADDEKKASVPIADPSLQQPDVQAAIKAQETHEFDSNVEPIRHTFGTLPLNGEPEGFQVYFSRYGAGIIAVLMNDHFATPAAAKLARENPADLEDRDYYAIVPAYPDVQPGKRSWDYGLVLEGRGKARFSKAIDDGDKHQLWECVTPQPGDSEVIFRLNLPKDNLVLEKVFRYVPGDRHLEIDINLRSVGDRVNAPSSYDVRMRGVHLWNPKRARVFQNPAGAVGMLVDAAGEQKPNMIQASGAMNATLLAVGISDQFEFAGTTNRFFGGLLLPADEDTRSAVKGVATTNWPSFERVIPFERDGKKDAYIIEQDSVPEIHCDLTLRVPATNEVESLKFQLYLGPKTSTLFVDDYAPLTAVMESDLTSSCCCPVPGVATLATVISWLVKFFHSVVGNWGWAIVMLTLLVRILLSPLNFNMQRTMRIHGAKMAKLKPELTKIQTQYKDDPKQLQMEMMKFNKEHKLISAPLKGCLPILVTMPIWFGLFTALRVMYELRHQPFFGWIDDLSTPDQLFATGIDWAPVAHFNLLPIIMVALWLYLQMATPLPKDPQQRQMMVMMRFMPIMMGVMLYNYASGLMIYMCTSSVWGIVEQKLTKRILGPVNPDAGMSMPTMV